MQKNHLILIVSIIILIVGVGLYLYNQSDENPFSRQTQSPAKPELK